MAVDEQTPVEEPMPPLDPEDLQLQDPATLEFRQESGRLQWRKQGEEEWKKITLARLFPLTDPESWLAMLDAEGKEIGILQTLQGLSRQSLKAVRGELECRYLVPRIKRIIACRDRFDLLEWEVETDRGPLTFLLRNPQESVTQPFANYLCFADVEGNRYDVDDVRALDEESRKWIDERL
ncbi:MAG: DUF1854 domain-containing protein [Armatimonadota bacterium]